LLIAEAKVALVNSGFIMANTPPGHRIFFVSYSPWTNEHENAKETLKSMGVSYEERIQKLGETEVGLFRRHRVDRWAHHIFSSTDRGDVIKSVFDSYTSWESGWPFFFFVAKEEPTGWKKMVDVLSSGEACPQNLVLESHCIMRTVEDHGILISSVKITEMEVKSAVAILAKELSMYPTVKRFAAQNVREPN